MATLTEARESLREAATKELAIIRDTRLTDAQKISKTAPLQREVERWHKEVSDLEYVDAQRKALDGAEARWQNDAPLASEFAPLHRAAKAGGSAAITVARKAFLSVTLPPQPRNALVGGDYLDSPSILGLFAQEPANAPTVRAYRVGNVAQGWITAEGAAKQDAGLTLDYLDTPMVKIANSFKVSDEAVEDFAPFLTTVQSELARAIVAAENTYGVGVTLAAPGLATATSSSAVDGVADAIAALANTSGVVADGAVINPTDLASVRKERVGSGNTAYVIDPQTSAPTTLHGVRLVVSPAVAAGTVLVGSFKTAGIAYVRSGLRVDVGLSEDDFTRNLRTLRAEERVALVVTRPVHLVKVTIS